MEEVNEFGVVDDELVDVGELASARQPSLKLQVLAPHNRLRHPMLHLVAALGHQVVLAIRLRMRTSVFSYVLL